MEIWEYIKVLTTPNRTWLFSKDNTMKRIDALTKIADEGYPQLISNLIPLLEDSSKEIRETSCKTIIHLFTKINSKKEYYDTLKYCPISKQSIDYYESNFPIDQYMVLLAICSLNRSGHVREKAVEKLAQTGNPDALQFLIYRLADWVVPVRQVALQGIEKYKSIQYIDNLIENLPIFEWLQKVERVDLNKIYKDIIEYIISSNRDYVIANFRKYQDKIRLIIAKEFSASLTVSNGQLNILLTDKHFLVRALAIEHFNELTQSEINQLLYDKSAKVRIRTLYCLKGRNNFKDLVRSFLADNSSTIRHFARFTLKPNNIDFAEFYYQNLQGNRQVIGSIFGLAEVDAKQFAEKVKKYLGDERAKVKKAAFFTLCKLDEASAYEFAYSNLDNPQAGIRNVIIDFLSRVPKEEVLTRARKIYMGSDAELKKSMLKLFNKIGGWEAIPDLIMGTIDEQEDIRQIALIYLQKWRNHATRLFSTPKPTEIERAKQVFNFAYETHKHKQYFKTNPIEGLDFYLT